ncbi:MAG: hypothetical protein VX279_02140 [Candidatus Neomarinimicrobiota bacterium]|nr:hypothetical protein [Candidatus Neomarinimicrobiota bacterium]
MVIRKSIIFFALLVLFKSDIQSQSLNIDVQGEIYEYATYYVSSFDVATGATNVQIFNYSLTSNIYPVYIKIRFRATIISPGLGINNEATIVEVETDPFQIQDGLYLDNRDLSSERTFINDNSGNQIELQGRLIDVLDPGLSEAIMQTILTSGKLSDGQYTFSVMVYGGLTENDLSLVFDDSKTFVIQSQVPITLESPGGALSDTTDNLLYTNFPIFQWSSGPPCAGCETYIRVAQFDSDVHSGLEDAIEDQRVLPSNQNEDWELIDNVNSFQYPFSGAYPLDAGNVYCWQIRIALPTTSGTEDMLSPIYAFKIGQAGNIETTSAITDPLLMMLKQAIPDKFNSYFGPGMALDGYVPSGQIEINGVTVDQSVINNLLQQIMSQNYQINSVQVE